MPDKRLRLTLLILLIVALLVTVPYFLLRASGYRFDSEHWRFFPTGAVAIRAVPIGAHVTVQDDNETYTKTITAFSATAFFPDMLPGTSPSMRPAGHPGANLQPLPHRRQRRSPSYASIPSR